MITLVFPGLCPSALRRQIGKWFILVFTRLLNYFFSKVNRWYEYQLWETVF